MQRASVITQLLILLPLKVVADQAKRLVSTRQPSSQILDFTITFVKNGGTPEYKTKLDSTIIKEGGDDPEKKDQLLR